MGQPPKDYIASARCLLSPGSYLYFTQLDNVNMIFELMEFFLINFLLMYYYTIVLFVRAFCLVRKIGNLFFLPFNPCLFDLLRFLEIS